jgi:hypothetical protein
MLPATVQEFCLGALVLSVRNETERSLHNRQDEVGIDASHARFDRE